MARTARDVNRFLRLDFDGWREGKTLLYIGCEPWREYGSGEVLGVRHTLMVSEDETQYPREDTTNLGVQLVVKERGVGVDDVKLTPMVTAVEVVDVEKATPYHPGDSRAWDISIIAKVRPARAARGGDE